VSWWAELTERGGEGMVVTPLERRVHECVFGVLALESEPVAPRL
jgi:PNKP adenylyltransferase domain, C-terminal region